MAKQMILAHLTHDHPYLFHGCWPHRLPTSITSPQEPWQWGELAMRASVWKTKTGMKTEKKMKASENEHKKESCES